MTVGNSMFDKFGLLDNNNNQFQPDQNLKHAINGTEFQSKNLNPKKKRRTENQIQDKNFTTLPRDIDSDYTSNISNSLVVSNQQKKSNKLQKEYTNEEDWLKQEEIEDLENLIQCILQNNNIKPKSSFAKTQKTKSMHQRSPINAIQESEDSPQEFMDQSRTNCINNQRNNNYLSAKIDHDFSKINKNSITNQQVSTFKVRNKSVKCDLKSAKEYDGSYFDEMRNNCKSMTMSYSELFLQNKQSAHRYYQEIKESLTVTEFLFRKQPSPLFMKQSTKPQTIVFDLDETLIKATNDPMRFENQNVYDAKTELVIDKKIRKDVYISYRPYLFEMLRTLKKKYELIVFTAGFSTYADAIIKEMQREEKFFDHVISRDYCSAHPSGKHQVKDLIQLLENRSIKDIVIVDNKAISFAIHFTNGIPIKDYEGDKADKELLYLTQYLLSFQSVLDVRHKIRQDFRLDKLVMQRGIWRKNYQDQHSRCRSNIVQKRAKSNYTNQNTKR
eukprot:403356300